MRRFELQEIHDHPSFPGPLRDLATDGMQALWGTGNFYKPILVRLLDGMDRAGTREVLDLCSGGGGPWLRLVHELPLDRDPPITVTLTDKYPNRRAFEQASSVSSLLEFEPSPVDATKVPERLQGFRTLFTAFHHFGPEAARRLLGDAMALRQGVGIFELPRRSPRTFLALCFIPALMLWRTPRIRPFRWSRIFWTYLVPLVPFVLVYDGVLSCLKAYSDEDIQTMVRAISRPDYEWEIGVERSGLLPVTYLLGYPVNLQTE